MSIVGPMIELRNVSKRYADDVLPALVAISFRVARGEWLAILGPSGAGKTTILEIISGRSLPSGGTVTVLGRPLGQLEEAFARRRHVRTVFESADLLPGLNVVDNVARQVRSESRQRARFLAWAALRALGIDERGRAFIPQLSSSERQRVAIARALVGRPRIVLIDEPARHLDWRTAQFVFTSLRHACNAFGATIVHATCDMRSAAHAHRILRLEHGALADEIQAVPSITS